VLLSVLLQEVILLYSYIKIYIYSYAVYIHTHSLAVLMHRLCTSIYISIYHVMITEKIVMYQSFNLL